MKYFVIFRVTDDKGNFDEEDKIEITQSDFNKAFESAWQSAEHSGERE